MPRTKPRPDANDVLEDSSGPREAKNILRNSLKKPERSPVPRLDDTGSAPVRRLSHGSQVVGEVGDQPGQGERRGPPRGGGLRSGGRVRFPNPSRRPGPVAGTAWARSRRAAVEVVRRAWNVFRRAAASARRLSECCSSYHVRHQATRIRTYGPVRSRGLVATGRWGPRYLASMCGSVHTEKGSEDPNDSERAHDSRRSGRSRGRRRGRNDPGSGEHLPPTRAVRAGAGAEDGDRARVSHARAEGSRVRACPTLVPHAGTTACPLSSSPPPGARRRNRRCRGRECSAAMPRQCGSSSASSGSRAV